MDRPQPVFSALGASRLRLRPIPRELLALLRGLGVQSGT